MSLTTKLKDIVTSRVSAACGLVFLFSGMVCVSSATAMEFPEKRQKWLVLERLESGNAEVITVLNAPPSEHVRMHYSQLLSIAWSYESRPNGMPAETEIARGRILYAAFDQILGQDGIYAMSRTGNGGRTIYYYVRDFQSHSSALKEYLNSLTPICIKVSLREEPQWNSIFDVLNNIKRTK